MDSACKMVGIERTTCTAIEDVPRDGNDYNDAISCSFDDKDDIRMMMVLSALIYIMDGMRQISRENNLEANFLEVARGADGIVQRRVIPNSQTQHQILAGDYNFIDANGKPLDVNGNATTPTGSVPANPTRPNDLQSLLDAFPLLFQDLNTAYTRKNIEVLELFVRKNTDHMIYINNFNAVHNDQEVVYAIVALKKTSLSRRQAKREGLEIKNQVAVIFRGSVYSKDWLQNLSLNQVEIRIRINEKGGKQAWLIEGSFFQRIKITVELARNLQRVTKEGTKDHTPIRVHKGFLEYLFAMQETDSQPKYQAIVNNLCNLLEHGIFDRQSDVTITGHSLGGALGTLAAFFLACDTDVMKFLQTKHNIAHKYISCISFASPLVGNSGFQKAFEFLEKDDRLRHVRITNGRDFVPLSLPMPSYRHTGVHVHLRGKNWFGIQQDVEIEDSVNAKAITGAFVGCMLTTFPPVILFPVYLGFCHIPAVLALVGFAAIMVLMKVKQFPVNVIREYCLPILALSFLVCWALNLFLKLDALQSSKLLALQGKNILPSLLEPNPSFCVIVTLIVFATVDAVFGAPWKRVSLAGIAISLSFYQVKASVTVGLPDIEEVIGTIYSAVTSGGDGWMVGFIFLIQVLMLVRQPQHVYDADTKDEQGNTIGITHSLSFYDCNLTRARKHMPNLNLKSGDAIWEDVARHRT